MDGERINGEWWSFDLALSAASVILAVALLSAALYFHEEQREARVASPCEYGTPR